MRHDKYLVPGAARAAYRRIPSPLPKPSNVSSFARSTLPLPDLAAVPDLDEVQGRYRLRFARTEGDLDAIYRLRFEVFNVELGEGLQESYRTGRDQDPFDRQCQHLLVEEDATGAVVGTYRMQIAEAASRGRGFYSAGEFDLSGLPPEILQRAAELGRACVDATHRNRKVLFLLWRGLIAYLLHHGKRCFFGCSSLTSQDPAEGVSAYRHLLAIGAVHPQLRVQPLPGLECEAGPDARLPRVEIPKLFGLYLRYGAWVLGPPAIDREFGTIDFLTYVDIGELDERTLATLG